MKKVQFENWLSLLLGVWFFMTPWLVTHNLSEAQTSLINWNAWLVGAAVIISASLALQSLKPWEEWANLILGVWLILSPWILGYAAEKGLLWNSIIVGLAITVLSGLALPEAQKLQQRQLQ